MTRDQEFCKQMGWDSPEDLEAVEGLLRAEREALVEWFRATVRRHEYQCSECKDTTCLRIDMECRALLGEAYAVKRVQEVCGDECAVALRANGRGEGV